MKHIFSAHTQDTHEVLKFILLICACIVGIFIFLDFVLLTYWQIKEYVYQPPHATSLSLNESSEMSSSTKPLQPGRYEVDVKTTLLAIRAESVDETVYTFVRETLLQLAVPKEYLDFHLALIIKIDNLLAAYDKASENPSREHDLLVTQHTQELESYLASITWLEN